jgi:hypothetical protein
MPTMHGVLELGDGVRLLLEALLALLVGQRLGDMTLMATWRSRET